MSFDPSMLDRSVIAIPLLEDIRKDEHEIHAVIIDLNLDYPDGRDVAQSWVFEAIARAKANFVRQALALDLGLPNFLKDSKTDAAGLNFLRKAASEQSGIVRPVGGCVSIAMNS
jgi:hypothetical protein